MKSNSQGPISSRGIEALHTPLRPDLKIFFESKANQWDGASNRTGTFPLNMAENNISSDLVEDKINQIMKTKSPPIWTSDYTDLGGHRDFLNIVARFMSDHLCHCTISPDHIVASAGATAVIELMSWVLSDAGDTVVIPAPSYPVYTQDLYSKSKVKRFDLHTFDSLEEVSHGPLLSTTHLDQTLDSLTKKDEIFKILLLTTPDNPTGYMYTHAQLKSYAEWCMDHKIHLVVNELYGLSTIDTQEASISDDYTTGDMYASFAKIMQTYHSPYLHMIYGVSKDFGISGYRAGFFHTYNMEAIKAYVNLNAPHMISNITQWLLGHMLSDDQFLGDYIKENQKRLTASYAAVVDTLRALKVPYVPTRGSLFIWLDMQKYLTSHSKEGDQLLWQKIFNETGLLLTPGDGFGHVGFGKYRLVHAFLPTPNLEEAMSRLKKFCTSTPSSI
jgi:Aspartate/tyrosine/aromatic aminotransferase